MKKAEIWLYLSIWKPKY